MKTRLLVWSLAAVASVVPIAMAVWPSPDDTPPEPMTVTACTDLRFAPPGRASVQQAPATEPGASNGGAHAANDPRSNGGEDATRLGSVDRQ